LSGQNAVRAATAAHAAAADNPPITDRAAELARKPKPGFCALNI
jgi:hypothetical protein